MKYFFTTFFFIIFLLLKPHAAFCQNAAPNTTLINALFDAMNKHDSAAIAGFFDDSAKLESPNWEGQEKGKQGATTVYSRYFKGTPDLHFTVTNIVASNDAVVVEYTFAGQFSNPEAGTPDYMRNKVYSIKGSTRYNITNHKIIFAVSYFDQVSFLRQVGFFDQH